ncbi:hypothetical protein MBLNU459_g0349t1 [Dothideomycetes sp. NU459]
MEPQKNGHAPAAAADDADFVKAFQELQRGEQTASALESHLTALEAKIEELLAQANQNQSAVQGATDRIAQSTSSESSNTGTGAPDQSKQ